MFFEEYNTEYNTVRLDRRITETDKRECEEDTYTKAPPALPSLVTLPFPKEPFISFIAASSAFCYNGNFIAKMDIPPD